MSDRRRSGLVVAGLTAVTLVSLVVPTVAVAQEHERCEDLLVAHGPAGSTGDTSAVAITSQVLDRGVEGWASVAWQAAPTTDLRAIIAVSPASLAELPASVTTVDGPILELWFCGTTQHVATTGGDGVRDRTADASSAAAHVTRARSSTAIGLPALPLGIGVAVGAAGALLLLLLRRTSRDDHQVMR